MKKLIIIFLASVSFLGACQLLSSDNETSPEIKIEPSPVITGKEAKVSISHSKEFIMPYCGGITYEIEKLESKNWVVIDGQYGPCNGMMLPETYISESININFIIKWICYIVPKPRGHNS